MMIFGIRGSAFPGLFGDQTRKEESEGFLAKSGPIRGWPVKDR